MSSATFSQNVTNKTNLVCFPDSVAKKIAIDLIRGDSLRAELRTTKTLVSLLENKISIKSAQIIVYNEKCKNYETQIDLYKQKEYKYQEIVTGLESDVRHLRRKNKFFKYVTIGLGVTTVALFTTTVIN